MSSARLKTSSGSVIEALLLILFRPLFFNLVAADPAKDVPAPSAPPSKAPSKGSPSSFSA